MGKIMGAFILVLLCAPFLNSENYQVSVTTVNVWVKVLDKSGQPVTGLTQSDFEVYEDNKKMNLTCFEAVNSLTAAPQPAEQTEPVASAKMPQVPRKKFVLFLDLLNTSQPEYVNIKPKIDQFVDQVTKSGWDAMVAGLTPQAKLGIFLQPTNRAERLHHVIDTVQANPERDLRVLKNERELRNLLESGAGKASETIISQAFRMARGYSAQEKQNSKFSLDAMESFANYLQDFNRGDHMVILYISGGFNGDPGRHYYEILREMTGMEGNAVTFPEGMRETQFDLSNEVKNSIGRLNRADITVYAVNTRGLNSYGADATMASIVHDSEYAMDYQDSLAQIAQETGGVAFQNSQNFQVGFDKIFSDLNNQYLMCYNAPEHKKPAEYHHIKVVVKRPDVSLRYRRGYIG